MEPLEVNLWHNRLMRIVIEVESADGKNLERLMRRVYHMAVLAPVEVRDIFGTNFLELEFEKYLDQQDFDNAARTLFGSFVEYTDIDANGFKRVKLGAPLANVAIEKSCATYAQAVVLAWAQLAFTLCDPTILRYPDQHKSRF